MYDYAPEDSGFLPGRGAVDAARTATLRACNDAADKWAYTTWQSTELAVYRSCMTERGQRFE